MADLVTPVRDTRDALVNSFGNALNTVFGFLPALLGALLILALGWVVSGIVGRLIERGLRVVGLDRAVERAGVHKLIQKTGPVWSSSRIFGEISKWFLRLVFIQASVQVLELPQLSAVINSIVLFIPHILVAAVVVVLGVILARAAKGIVLNAAEQAGYLRPERWALGVQYLIVVSAVVAAINQLAIAPIIVNTLYIAVVSAVAIGVGISFGLGGRDVAGQIARQWYERGRKEREASLQAKAVSRSPEVTVAKSPLPGGDAHTEPHH